MVEIKKTAVDGGGQRFNDGKDRWDLLPLDAGLGNRDARLALPAGFKLLGDPDLDGCKEMPK